MFKTIQEALNQGSGKVSIRGWVYRERKMKNFCFLVMRDGSNIVQCIVEKDKVTPEEWEAVNKILVESSCEITGNIVEDKRAPTGFEIKTEKLNVVQFADVFPITKDQSTELLLDVRHLWIRSRQLTAIFKIKSTVLEASREFFKKEGYYEVTPPIITGSSCEGGSTLFEINYFKQKAFLSQSAQLYQESLIFSLDKVYAITPSFRAEPSKTSRHLTEYWHLEPEAAWITYEELQQLTENLISYICLKVAERNPEELKQVGRDPADLKKMVPPFPRMTYDDALKLLKQDGMEVEWGKDLRTLEEEQLMKHYDKPLLVLKYPKSIKAFYMKEDPENHDVVQCFDVLAPEGHGEIVGGSMREENYESVKQRLIQQGENPEHYTWYLDLRKYGSVPHGGFGMGIERVVKWICKLDNIRDTIPYPRTINRSTP